MEKQINQSKEEEISLKIKLLDIFPSISELKEQKEELDIVFQGLDTFYNLLDLLSKKNEIMLKNNNKRTIIICLIKSNNIFATSVFNIKQGEQWITFTYTNKKKKDTTLAQSLTDCIKIKLNCDINQNSYFNNNMLYSKIIKYNNLKNNSKLDFGSLLIEDSNHKSQTLINPNFHKINITNKTQTNKGYKKITLESSPKVNLLEKSKYFLIRNNKSINNNPSNNQYNIIDKKKHFKNDNINNKEKSLRRIKTKDNYRKTINDKLSNKLSKIFNRNDDSKLNLTQKSTKNYMNKLDSSSKSKKTFNFNNINRSNLLFSNFGSNSSQKDKNFIIKSKLLFNKKNKTEIKNITQEYNNKKNEIEISVNNINFMNNSGSICSNNMDNSKIKKIKNKIEKNYDDFQNMNLIGLKSSVGSKTNRRNKDIIKDLKNNTSTNTKTPEITKSKFKSGFQNTIDSKKYFLTKDIEIKDQSTYKNISSDFDLDNDEEGKFLNDISNDSNDDINNYFKLREDFILLYNEIYVKNIQEDLLKLEIELFVEKMTGLIEAYHQAINEGKIENKIIADNLKENSEKYLTLSKLYYKLNLVKKKYKKKYLKVLKNKTNIEDINNKNFDTNKNELQLFKLIFPSKDDNKSKDKTNVIDKKVKLKNILNLILSNLKDKNVIMKTDLYKKWEEINNDDLNNIIVKNENINKSLDSENKYIKPKARSRAIPKLQQTKFKSKNYKGFMINENKSEENLMINNNGINSIYNSFTHNSNIDYDTYNKNSAVYSIYSNKCYSKKKPK